MSAILIFDASKNAQTHQLLLLIAARPRLLGSLLRMCEIRGGQLAILFVIAEARRTASVATLLSVIVDSLITTHHGTGHYLMILRTDCLLLMRHVCRVLLVAFASATSVVF